MSDPVVVERAEQRYVAIPALVTMAILGDILPPLMPEVFAFLGARGVSPSGPPFWRYRVIDMPGHLEVEVGVAVAAEVTGDGRIRVDVLPAGQYATVLHHGHPDGLERATADLLRWAADARLQWDVAASGAGERWGCRLEEYLTDPAEVPNMNQWDTRLAFRLLDPS